MLCELEGIVRSYYLWTKITESSMLEMHANKRHGCGIVCTRDAIYNMKFASDIMISCISLSHNMKILDIAYNYVSYIFGEQGKISCYRFWVGRDMHLVNLFHTNGDFLSSAFTDIDGERIGTSVVSNGTGGCYLVQHSK